MEIKIFSKEEITIVEISGSLDSNTAPQAQEKIIPLIVPNCLLVFDMSKCNYISSAGLRILLMIAKALNKENGKGVLAGLSEEIKDVMEMTGFDNMFQNFASIQEAIEDVKK